MGNALMVVAPYWFQGSWVFDNPALDLDKEPLLLGDQKLIDELVSEIPDAKRGFRMIFSEKPFSCVEKGFLRIRQQKNPKWMRLGEFSFAEKFNPTFFKYFNNPPKRIFMRIEPRKEF